MSFKTVPNYTYFVTIAENTKILDGLLERINLIFVATSYIFNIVSV